MDIQDTRNNGGSLQISTDVIEKIAQHAALEVEGVCRVKPAAPTNTKTLLDKIAQPRAVTVELNNDVADVTVSLVVSYGAKIPEISEKVQKSVKEAVQNMTSISVGRVDVVVTGLSAETESA